MTINPLTPPGGVLDDLAQETAWELGMRGLIDPANGTTRRIPGIRTEEELMGTFNGWFHERQQQQGGAALDEAFTPRDASYADRRYRTLEQFEGYREGVYRDNVGLRTVGVGFNMEQSGARRMWEAAGLTVDRFDDVREGRARMSQPEVRRLADYTMELAEGTVRTRMGNAQMTEQQRLALVSIAFNGPALVGPKLTAAVQRGDWLSAANEVLYDSGTRTNPALARRRYHEATMLLGADAPRLLPTFEAYRANPGQPPQAVTAAR